ncbi:OsmC family peroxiredoxin [Fulvivirga sp. RKSG066]|uniref:OsmC family protein n=1 Tax=Fulvivirga aurantia TaxID=2529383 RepID=UPI0012BCA96B|nr:OsmC family protein [Fulvivirga aurantia]MTI22604.1 OsmC family peroxiredoxin [Fulvivirga aurantia]
MKITTKYITDHEYNSFNEQGNKVFIDMKDENKTGQSPMEMILSALSGCVAVEVSQMIQKRRKELKDLTVEAYGVRKADHPRGFTHITLKFILTSPDANIEELDKVTKLSLEKYCSVAESLKAEIKFETEIVR